MPRPANADPPTSRDSRVLVTDLDGTLIPLAGRPEQAADLATLAGELRDRRVRIVFATGRRLETVLEAIEEHDLPLPEAVIARVGTEVHHLDAKGEASPVEAYTDELNQIVAGTTIAAAREALAGVPGLDEQESQRQGAFKLSFDTDAESVHATHAAVAAALAESRLPYEAMASVDPIKHAGMIDVLPSGVSKGLALRWWMASQSLDELDIVYAGDSGNDLAALASGCRAVVVGNAQAGVAGEVHASHRRHGWRDRVYFATGDATTGLLEGCRWFGLAEPAERSPGLLGAECLSHRKTAFRVWAPRHWKVAVELGEGDDARQVPLERDGDGCYAGEAEDAGPGTPYRLVIDDARLPDPRSRRQPSGVHGPSEVVAPRSFAWSDAGWRGVPTRELVTYELHVGTFTPAGTFRAAIERLPELVQLGVTAVELLPVIQTAGSWNWGYDGVNLFAVRESYGEPDDLRALVDACHHHGLAVLLDVVYNHLGPEGNYLPRFAPYDSPKRSTPWGDAFNYDDRHAEPVRRFVIDNALSWLDEFHFDGLRLDAAYFMHDESQPHILRELAAEVARFGERAGRHVHLVAEANAYAPDLLKASAEGPGCDAAWGDCLLHSLLAIAAPDTRVVDRPYRSPADLVQSLDHGFVYQGERFERQPPSVAGADEHLRSLVVALQNHDAVGNHPRGLRVHQLSSVEFQMAAAALVLLHPGLPLIFMGEEYATDTPFPFFADFQDKRIRTAVRKGRRRDHAAHGMPAGLPPLAEATFQSAKLGGDEVRRPEVFAWYQTLLRIRREGLAAGWLDADNYSAGYREDPGVFWMRYQQADDRTIEVLCRLTGGPEPLASPVRMPIGGELLASSPAPSKQPGQTIELAPNHAVVVRR
ncbi:MAG: malto-oligosyltrehalose trehalohydrolase [Planctomycetota bacterium]